MLSFLLFTFKKSFLQMHHLWVIIYAVVILVISLVLLIFLIKLLKGLKVFSGSKDGLSEISEIKAGLDIVIDKVNKIENKINIVETNYVNTSQINNIIDKIDEINYTKPKQILLIYKNMLKSKKEIKLIEKIYEEFEGRE